MWYPIPPGWGICGTSSKRTGGGFAIDASARYPAEFAREVAAQVDRVAIGVHPLARARSRNEVVQAGLTGGTGVLVSLAAPLLSGPAPAGDLHAVERYSPWPDFVATLDTHIAQGMLERGDDGRYGLTAPGHRLCAAIRAAQGAAITESWQPAADVVSRLLPLTDRLVAAGWETAGTAYAVMAGARDPQAASPAHLLLIRVTALRYHRADAHAAAWAAAGLTAEQAVALPDGPSREPIEADTNRRAGAPYTALTSAERAVWLDGLRALPG